MCGARRAPSAGYCPSFPAQGVSAPRNRDYDPTTATFLTPDPLTQGPGSPELGTGIPFEGGTPVETNSYHYVANDPLNFVDPLGLCRAHDGVFLPAYDFGEEGGGAQAACAGHSEWSCDAGGETHGPGEAVVIIDSSYDDCYTEWTDEFNRHDCLWSPDCWLDATAFGINTPFAAPQALAIVASGRGDCFVDRGSLQWTCSVDETTVTHSRSNCQTLVGLVQCPSRWEYDPDVYGHEHAHAVQQAGALHGGWLAIGAVDVLQAYLRTGEVDACDLVTEWIADREAGGYRC